MKRTIALFALLFTFAMGVALAEEASAPVSTPAPKASKPAKKAKAKPAAKEVWVCPMGDYKGPKTADGKCPNCKMDLEKFRSKKDKAKVKEGAPKAAAPASEGTKIAWTCPMCGGHFDKAGKCPECGMDLIQKK